MFSKSLIASLFFLALTSSVNAHAGVTPALGVKGALSRSDVQRPSTADPCGNVNIAQTLDSSTAVPADANGTFSPTIQNFNPGADGSRSIKTVQVDASGTGKNFVAAKMLVNGDATPTDDATQQLTVQLPAGTKCTGGASKDLCLASFTTTSGFGNCVAVSQGTGAAGAAASKRAPSRSKPVRNGAAKGMRRATPTDQPNPPKPSEPGDPKKDAGKAKTDDSAKKGDKTKNDEAKNGDKSKDKSKSGDKSKGKSKNDDKTKTDDRASTGDKSKSGDKSKDKSKSGDKSKDKSKSDDKAKTDDRASTGDKSKSGDKSKDKSKSGDKSKDKSKSGDKSKNGDKGKSANGPTPTNAAARRMAPKRNWSSRRSLTKLEA